MSNYPSNLSPLKEKSTDTKYDLLLCNLEITAGITHNHWLKTTIYMLLRYKSSTGIPCWGLFNQGII
jgi:hypothetical protein